MAQLSSNCNFIFYATGTTIYKIKKVGYLKPGSCGNFPEDGVCFFGGMQRPDLDRGKARFETFLLFPLCRFFFTGRNEDDEGIVFWGKDL